MSKKLQDKQRRRVADQMRREQQRKAARRSNYITIGIALVIVALVVVGVITFRESEEEAPPAPEGVAASAAGCDEVQEPEDEGNDHVPAGTEVEYNTSPPTSGNHWPPENVADPSFYPDPVSEESLVHNMEHGQIIIWYRPDAPQETISDIDSFTSSANDADALPGGALQPIIAVPYEDVDEDKAYVLTAWGASQACARYSLAAINEFRERYQGRSPEPVAPPFSG
ncbi:MAG: DUF3105 domain-containing protein [Actinomycetota bacterium]|nr:DUF3105 domain-containing protein [Actinomycetota bacterium]